MASEVSGVIHICEKTEVPDMRRYRCIMCDHKFEVDDKVKPYKCPKCMERFVELLEGSPVKGKQWGSKSFSVK
jgi:DNA-directed RNA polymerase subunit RPC12/RpoP